MMQRVKSHSFLYLIISAVLVSCTTVTIETGEINPVVKKLEETNRKSISLFVHAAEDFKSAGHQYLLLAIPFGLVLVETPELSVYNEAATQLAIAGYKINSEANLQNKLNLIITNLQLTAYDLLFMRRIYCNLELLGDYHDAARHKKISVAGKGEESSYKVTGFKPQLEHVFSKCLERAINQVLVRIK